MVTLISNIVKEQDTKPVNKYKLVAGSVQMLGNKLVAGNMLHNILIHFVHLRPWKPLHEDAANLFHYHW